MIDGFDFDLDMDLDMDLDLDTEFDFDVVDADFDGIADVHEAQFVNTTGGAMPDVLSADLDLDADGIPDHFDGDLDNDGVPDGMNGPDMDGDGMGDFADPFVDDTDNLVSDHTFVRTLRAIHLYNPFFK